MNPVRHLVRTTKALADESRIRIVGALKDRELCVCQLIELLCLAPSTVSKHLSILRNARLIDSRKQGRWMYYRLAGQKAPRIIVDVLEWTCRSIAETDQFIADSQRMEAILNIDPEILCSRQNRSASCDPDT
jgi:ArsR family transcriptional regulator, arsenate/arsenite/antimonite-responsive transcriptional repressor